MSARGHRDGDRPEGARAVDVERRVADDHDLVGTERVARQRVSPSSGQRRQPPAVQVVGAEGPDREVRPEPGRAELDPRPFLDIAGQQSQQYVRRLRQPPHELRHAGQRHDIMPFADLLGQAARVRLEEVAQTLPDAPRASPAASITSNTILWSVFPPRS